MTNLNGTESALAVAALFALAQWPFQTAGAKELVSAEHKAAAEPISDVVSARWRELLDAKGYWNPGGLWTPELIAKRASLESGLSLSATDLPVVVLALDAVTKEFADNWNEFCTVIPGAIDWYPVGPADMARLARRLERLLVQ